MTVVVLGVMMQMAIPLHVGSAVPSSSLERFVGVYYAVDVYL